MGSISGYIQQISIQGAILTELAKAIRAGELGYSPSKIVYVGHSIGSVVSAASMNTDPDVVDGAVLTGFALAAGSAPVLGLEAQQNRLANLMDSQWSHLDGGFQIWVDKYALAERFVYSSLWQSALIT